MTRMRVVYFSSYAAFVASPRVRMTDCDFSSNGNENYKKLNEKQKTKNTSHRTGSVRPIMVFDFCVVVIIMVIILLLQYSFRR